MNLRKCGCLTQTGKLLSFIICPLKWQYLSVPITPKGNSYTSEMALVVGKWIILLALWSDKNIQISLQSFKVYSLLFGYIKLRCASIIEVAWFYQTRLRKWFYLFSLSQMSQNLLQLSIPFNHYWVPTGQMQTEGIEYFSISYYTSLLQFFKPYNFYYFA